MNKYKIIVITKIDYHKVGEEFDYNGRRFRVVRVCEACDMNDDCEYLKGMSCYGYDRIDDCYVIYKEVNLRKRWMRNLVFILAVLLCFLFISAVVVIFLDSNYLLAALMVVAGLFMVVDAIYNKYGRR